MAKQIETPYQYYEFTEDELPVARTFTELNLQHIKTELAIAAIEKMNLAYDPLNPNQFIMENEFVRGKIEALKALVITHEDMLEALAERQYRQTLSQQQE